MLEWNIVKIDRWRDNDTVIRIDFVIRAKSNQSDLIAEKHAGIEFNPHLPTGGIPYNQLTEERLLEWIWRVIDRKEWEDQILKKLEIVINDNN